MLLNRRMGLSHIVDAVGARRSRFIDRDALLVSLALLALVFAAAPNGGAQEPVAGKARFIGFVDVQRILLDSKSKYTSDFHGTNIYINGDMVTYSSRERTFTRVHALKVRLKNTLLEPQTYRLEWLFIGSEDGLLDNKKTLVAVGEGEAAETLDAGALREVVLACPALTREVSDSVYRTTRGVSLRGWFIGITCQNGAKEIRFSDPTVKRLVEDYAKAHPGAPIVGGFDDWLSEK